MASNAFAGVGAEFRIGDSSSSGAVFTKLAEVNSIQGPGMSRTTIDVTSLDSTGGYREFIASFRDGGEVTLELNFTRAGYEAILAEYQKSSSVDYQIALPDVGNTILQFTAWCTNLGNGIPTDDKVTANATFKVTGPVAISSGS